MTAQHFNGFTPLPPYPTPEMPDDAYNAAAYATTEAYPVMISEMTTAAGIVESNANYSEQQAGASGAAAEAAAKTLIDVQAAANGAFASANYKGEWVSLSGALNVPATVTHLGRLWYLKANLANVASQAPALGSTYWGEVSRNDFTVLPSPSGWTLAADRGFYRMSSGSSVLQLPASPFHGMVVAAVNVSGTLTPYIQRNGKTICGDAEDYVMNVLNWQIALQFDSASNDWVRINGVTAYTAAQPAIGSANTWTAPQNFTGGLNMNGSPVVESGSNANGTYTRWADGTQECTKVLTTSAGSTTAKGALFAGPVTVGGAFLVPFIATPSVAASGTDSAGGGWVAMDIFPDAGNWGSYSTRNTSAVGAAGTIYLTARGRWK
ncbi:hypothetical protein [Comamonas sp.]|uniref:hypothetical protein n=1 Tax=Comamonas sp. TaxID=34028 RepID=UPI003D0E2EE0